MAGGIECIGPLPHDAAFGDLDGDQVCTAPEWVQVTDGSKTALLVIQIEQSASDAGAKIRLLRDIARLHGPKGRLLQLAYLNHGSSTAVKEGIRADYAQPVRWSGRVWSGNLGSKGPMGRLAWHPNLFVHGTEIRTVPVQKRISLLRRHAGQIDRRLARPLSRIARDEQTFLLLAHFLEQGGRFEVLKGFGGNDESPGPVIRPGLESAASGAYRGFVARPLCGSFRDRRP